MSIAQVDDTRARVLLAQGNVAKAEGLVGAAVQALENGGQQGLLAAKHGRTEGAVLSRY